MKRTFFLLLTLAATALADAIRLGEPVSDVGASKSAVARHTASSGAAAIPSSWYDTSNRETVARAWREDYAGTINVPTGFTGNVDAGIPGDTSAQYKAAVQQRINWFRAMAGVPAVITFRADFNTQAQQGALMIAANSALSHNPPSNWKWYTQTGATALATSNICAGLLDDAGCVEAYMEDFGSSNPGVGHRRWILFPNMQTMGTGDVQTATNIWNVTKVLNTDRAATRPATRHEFVAWPPPGYVPYQTLFPRWSFSFPGADFSTAQVTLTRDGTPLPVTQAPTVPNFGENTLVWVPQGQNPSTSRVRTNPGADDVYDVTITGVKVGGVTRTFNYQVIVFDPTVFTLTPPTVPTVPAGGGSGSLSVGSTPVSTEWVPVTNVPWIQVGKNGNILNYVVGANPGAARAGIITVGNASVTITQAAATTGGGGCTFTLAQNTVNVPAGLTSGTVNLTASAPTCTWTGTSTQQRWAQAFPNGTGSAAVVYTIFPNFSTNPRTAQLTIGGQPLVVNQAGATGTTMERFVTLLYFNLLNRMPTADEVAFNVGAGVSREVLAYRFLTSPEFNLGGRFVAGLYLGILNRDPEYTGWQYQRNALSSWSISHDAMTIAFLESAEFKLNHPSLTNEQFVVLLYGQILGRTPNGNEIAFNVGHLQNGMPRYVMARNFLRSPEFEQGKYSRLLAFLLHATFLNRDPSPTEFNHRRQQIENNARLEDLVAQFVNSTEFNAQFQ
ncbi:MAG TPA: DUF4214 domain-containing protein [Bryobacteraceae bacterium]|nr:DUF4214 domain-containing protein [Bryobacteraceae bacterium]